MKINKKKLKEILKTKNNQHLNELRSYYLIARKVLGFKSKDFKNAHKILCESDNLQHNDYHDLLNQIIITNN